MGTTRHAFPDTVTSLDIGLLCKQPPIAWSRSPFQMLERDPRRVPNTEVRSFQAMTKVRKEESSGGMRMKCKVIRGNRRGF